MRRVFLARSEISRSLVLRWRAEQHWRGRVAYAAYREAVGNPIPQSRDRCFLGSSPRASRSLPS